MERLYATQLPHPNACRAGWSHVCGTARASLHSLPCSRIAGGVMDLDALLFHFFGTTDLDALDEAVLADGRDRIGIAFGTEREPGRRFALWVLLHGLGGAPDPAIAFKDPRERDAAQAYARAMDRVERG